MKRLLIKEEGLNPTGSFKARGLVMAVSRALELGVKTVVIPSAGNAAGAMSAYAAAAGMRAIVFMPSDTPSAFIFECKGLGAEGRTASMARRRWDTSWLSSSAGGCRM